MKKSKSTIFLVAVLIVGLFLLLYPKISDCWNSFHQSRAITNYSEKVSNLDAKEYKKALLNAKEYNKNLLKRENKFYINKEEKTQYNRLLNIDGTGLMGYLEIPSIDVFLPIYHGTEETILQHSIGHLEWSSLPVGGENTHSVLSGHRGLPSAKLFTHLDKMEKGDHFVVKILNEVMTYQVDQILIIEPEAVDALGIIEGKDFCTLMTCTPYGINTHRLLVRGHRVENIPKVNQKNISVKATKARYFFIFIIAIFCLFLLKSRIKKEDICFGNNAENSSKI